MTQMLEPGNPGVERGLGCLLGDPEIPQPPEPSIDTGRSPYPFLLPHLYLYSRWKVWEGSAGDSEISSGTCGCLVSFMGQIFPRSGKAVGKTAVGILEISPSESASVPLLPSERAASLLNMNFPRWLPPLHLTSFCATGPSFPVGSLPWPFPVLSAHQ